MARTHDPAAPAPVHRDERTAAVEGAGYRLAYLVLGFGLLLDVAYRSFFRGEQPWDLMALVVAGGLVSALYQARERTLSRPWAMSVLATVVAAAVVAGVVVVGGAGR